MTEPLILTAALAPADQARFDRLRDAHFPPERNYLDAHVTLFHHLPGEQFGSVTAVLAEAAQAYAAFPMTVTGLRSLGRGVAATLASETLSHLRSELARRWDGTLTAQDRQAFRPHITIQNKVDPATARALLAELSAGFAPFEIGVTGLRLWRYLGGPWSPAGDFPFKPPAGDFPFTGRPADPPASPRR